MCGFWCSGRRGVGMHGGPTALRGEEVGRSRLRDVGPCVVMKTFGMKLCGIVGMASG